MTDIFDEKDMSTTRTIVSRLREHYLEEVRSPNSDSFVPIDLDERNRCTRLAMNFPDEDLTRQIIIDLCKIMIAFNIDPKHVRW